MRLKSFLKVKPLTRCLGLPQAHTNRGMATDGEWIVSRGVRPKIAALQGVPAGNRLDPAHVLLIGRGLAPKCAWPMRHITNEISCQKFQVYFVRQTTATDDLQHTGEEHKNNGIPLSLPLFESSGCQLNNNFLMED
jgi:hypothetical protein